MSSGWKSLTTGSIWIAVLIVTLMLPLGNMAKAADATDADAGAKITMVFGTSVDPDTRAIIGESATFSSDSERIFCYTKISGADAPTTLTHAWYYKGKTKARVDLNIGAATWRTWSSKKIMPHWVGLWEVKVLDEAGQVLATGNFEIN